MLPLTRELARTDRDWLHSPDWADLGVVESVASMRCLSMDSGQIRIYGRARLGMRIETLQLRMAGVTASFSAEHRFGQQRLTPKRNEPLRV
jgi:hypothetical protein